MKSLAPTPWPLVMEQWEEELARNECPHDLERENADTADRAADRRHDHSPNPIRSSA